MVMAYDHYAAVCKPLHYTRLVNRRISCVLVGAAWGGGFIHGIILFALSIHFPLCGLNILNNFFCDVNHLVKLTCANTYKVKLLMFLNNGIGIIMCFMLLLISYILLLLKLWTQSSKAKNIVTSTCVSRIIVVLSWLAQLCTSTVHPSKLSQWKKLLQFSIQLSSFAERSCPEMHSMRMERQISGEPQRCAETAWSWQLLRE